MNIVNTTNKTNIQTTKQLNNAAWRKDMLKQLFQEVKNKELESFNKVASKIEKKGQYIDCYV